MLNATLCAMTRVICIILELYQTDDGMDVTFVCVCALCACLCTFFCVYGSVSALCGQLLPIRGL